MGINKTDNIMEKRLDILPLKEWNLFNLFNERRPLLIAGPCSAESEIQIMETARGLKSLGVCVFRAGIWKPRTHPNTFEGVGTQGLKWLQRVKNELGMKICTEVASEKHIFDCMKFGVDMVWIGARTTANPFLVQEIADALKDTDIPVLVKNPVNPDLDLWIGALERLNQAGVRKLGVIRPLKRFQFVESIAPEVMSRGAVSPITRATAKVAPETMPGRAVGNTTWRIVRVFVTPKA